MFSVAGCLGGQSQCVPHQSVASVVGLPRLVNLTCVVGTDRRPPMAALPGTVSQSPYTALTAGICLPLGLC